jgi:coniferyl-aldehyde dehydrogenase
VAAQPVLSRDMRALFDAQRAAYALERYPTLARRQDRLARIGSMIDAHEQDIVAAIADDFGARPSQETRLAELFVIGAGVAHTKRHLRRWMAQQRAPTPLYL